MSLNAFHYERPASLEHLGQLLAAQQGIEPVYLAGGTDLLVAMRSGKDKPQLVIDLKGLPGLSGLRFTEAGGLWIGALTPIHSLEREPVIRERATAIYEAAQNLGSLQVRNRGTIGGNLANGAPTADTAGPLLALDAAILTWSPAGVRRFPVGDLWVTAGKTSLQQGEIITGVEIPLRKDISSAFSKLGPRNAMDIAIASAAVMLKLDKGITQEAKIALGGAGPTPIRSSSAESFLIGRPATPENIREAGKLAASDSNPRTSSRATREYRLATIPVLVERTINSALKRQEVQGEKGGQD